jgi:hypothetical protein
MKRSIFMIGGLAVVLFVGCNTATNTAPSADPSQPDKVRELSVTVSRDQTVKQNATDELAVSISRKNFETPVAIELRNLPPGVDVVTPDMTIPAGKTSINLTIRAKPDAKEVKDHKVQVAAIPKEESEMKEVVVDFKLAVKPKD